ncbi:hypothetical protein [Algoriphagus antarcticus]|uniref:Uncharacterized protein n=1 Tax=Algoriphagus antarcticus TaxID=238540 RepID=A0A3E0DFG8_9BACT|nr:hypothetical protein [Algoriphagus antarcticus]REG81366.1 hypothetical protein C8N25_12714 [Algoriphagus antarcticus]
MDKSIYLGGWEVNFNDEEELRNFIIQHSLTKSGFEVFTGIQSGLEIKTDNGKIIEILNQPGDEKVSGPLEFLIPEVKPHKLFWLKPSNPGKHQLGGKMPDELKILTDDSFKPFYLGQLDCKDEYFSWIGLDKLHLFYPLDFYHDPTFIDYADELKPELFNETNKSEYSPEKELSSIAFDATEEVTIKELENESDPIHLCGVPLWYQYPELPKCPKTGELMKFVCSISSTTRINIMKKGFLGSRKTKEFLMFGDMGTLYVFFHPKSKIAYLTIQF